MINAKDMQWKIYMNIAQLDGDKELVKFTMKLYTYLYIKDFLKLCVCVWICVWKWRCLWRPEASDSPGGSVISSFELLDMGAGNWTPVSPRANTSFAYLGWHFANNTLNSGNKPTLKPLVAREKRRYICLVPNAYQSLRIIYFLEP